MTITNAPSRQAFDDLVQLAAALRPTWQTPGIRAGIKAALNREQSFTFADLAYAVVKCASDPDCKTPAASTHEAHWRKGAPPARIYGNDEGDPRFVCFVCSMTEAACIARAATNGHEFAPRLGNAPDDKRGPAPGDWRRASWATDNREAEADHDPRKQADPTDTPRTTESEEQA